MKSYSEFGEDAFVMANVKLPDSGFYLDIGCAWPCLNSNTAFLRDRGWAGLNIDGNPVYAPKWQGVAQFTHCVIDDGNAVRFRCDGIPELSRMDRDAELVQSRRMDDLLQYSPNVDFISCDIEGNEYDALQTFDWKKNRPLCVVAEYSTYGLGDDFRVKGMLEAMGYHELHRTKANLIFTL